MNASVHGTLNICMADSETAQIIRSHSHTTLNGEYASIIHECIFPLFSWHSHVNTCI